MNESPHEAAIRQAHAAAAAAAAQAERHKALVSSVYAEDDFSARLAAVQSEGASAPAGYDEFDSRMATLEQARNPYGRDPRFPLWGDPGVAEQSARRNRIVIGIGFTVALAAGLALFFMRSRD